MYQIDIHILFWVVLVIYAIIYFPASHSLASQQVRYVKGFLAAGALSYLIKHQVKVFFKNKQNKDR
jgi:hypothetical protein